MAKRQKPERTGQHPSRWGSDSGWEEQWAGTLLSRLDRRASFIARAKQREQPVEPWALCCAL